MLQMTLSYSKIHRSVIIRQEPMALAFEKHKH